MLSIWHWVVVIVILGALAGALIYSLIAGKKS